MDQVSRHIDFIFTGRREDARLVTGAGRYTSDWNQPGQAYAVFVRADRAHAVINGIDTAAALAAPGVLAVLTGADMAAAGATRGQAHVPFKGRGGPIISPASPALALGKVRFVGESVAIVVAESAHEANDAAELIVIDYDDLQPVTDAAAALAEGAPQLHDSVPGNLCFDFEYGDEAATAAAFAGAAHVVRVQQISGRVVGNPMEPKAALAVWDGDVLDIWSPSQGITGMRDALAGVIGIKPTQVRSHAYDVGGAFGIRGGAYPEYAAVAIAARKVGRPVKWVATRAETFLSDYHGRALEMTAELALDAEGKFLAIRHDWISNIGAHPSGSGAGTNVTNASFMAAGAYVVPAIYGRLRLAVTNTVPITAYRGAGRPDQAYMVERLVEEAARQTGIDRVELRRRNFIPADAFPYKIATAPVPSFYDSANFTLLLDAALEEADWAGFEARRAEAATRGKLRGIGCAVFIEPAGGVSATDEVALTFEADGSLLIHEVAVASGQGHETVFPEIVGRALQIDPARISVRGGRVDSPVLKGGGAFGSRSMMSHGSVAVEAAGILLKKGMALAAEALEASEGDIVYADGAYAIAGTDRAISLADLAMRNPGALDTTAELPAPKAFPSGAHVAEVEVDPETGMTELVRYVSIDDCGAVINQTLLEGQIWGGLLQGLGQVFGEVCIYGEDGQMLSGTFMDYAMPHADLVKRVTIKLMLVPSPTNQLGVKGVGEAGTVGSLPTAMNAILDALRPAGVTHLDMPASAQRVWQALQG
jgi:carbon-monoxide dehydrogenase large subunit